MELKVREEKVFFVDHKDFDEFINHAYPDLQNKFVLMDDEEAFYDSNIELYADGEVDKWDVQRIQEGETVYMANVLLDDACRRGLAKRGMYIIQISK